MENVFAEKSRISHMLRFRTSTGQGGAKRYVAQADLCTAHKKRTSRASARALQKICFKSSNELRKIAYFHPEMSGSMSG